MESLLVTIEIDGIRHRMGQMLNGFREKQNDAIQAALEKALTVENVQAVLERTAEQEIKAAIAEEVSALYRYGKGRKALRDAIEKALVEDSEYTGVQG